MQVRNNLNRYTMTKLDLTDKEYSVLVNALEDYRDNMLDQADFKPADQKQFFKDQAERADKLLEKVKNA